MSKRLNLEQVQLLLATEPKITIYDGLFRDAEGKMSWMAVGITVGGLKKSFRCFVPIRDLHLTEKQLAFLSCHHKPSNAHKS